MKMKIKVYVKFLLNMLMKQKTNLFYNNEFKNKINFFSQIKLKIQPRIQKLKICSCLILTFLFNVNVNCSVYCELFCLM